MSKAILVSKLYPPTFFTLFVPCKRSGPRLLTSKNRVPEVLCSICVLSALLIQGFSTLSIIIFVPPQMLIR